VPTGALLCLKTTRGVADPDLSRSHGTAQHAGGSVNRSAVLGITTLALGVCSCAGGQSSRPHVAAPLLTSSVAPVAVTVAPVPRLPAGLVALGGVEPACRPGTARADGWCEDLGRQVRWYASRLPVGATSQHVLAAMSWSKHYRIVSQHCGPDIAASFCDIKLRSSEPGPGQGSIDVLVERAGDKGLRDPRIYGVNDAASEVRVRAEPKALPLQGGH
jgi:hypothetical protein